MATGYGAASSAEPQKIALSGPLSALYLGAEAGAAAIVREKLHSPLISIDTLDRIRLVLEDASYFSR